MRKPFAITLDPGSSLANHTGAWRTFRPVYVDRIPPCNDRCPAGENIQGWLFHAESGDYETAWRVLTRDNPLPVEEYLRPQTRFAHLFKPPGHPDVVARLQQMADRNIRRFGLLEGTESGS